MFVLWLLLGLVLLVAGAELLVRGGGQLALSLRVPALVVGLTVVAFATSMPELLVSVTAVSQRATTDLALANINGSNLANITLVLGLAAMVRPLTIERSLLRREIPTVLALTAAIPLLCLDNELAAGDGVLLLFGGVAYNAWLLFDALRGRAPAGLDDEIEGNPGVLRNAVLLAAALVALVLGARWFVTGAVGVAEALSLSDRFIGLTVVALGTSAPEVATGMVSAYRGETDLAVGNSLGSNLLNIAMVLGITAIVKPIELVEHDFAYTDMWLTVAVTSGLVVFVLKGSIRRVEGLVLATLYGAYLTAGYFGGHATIP
ncbi:MAG: calcium/sodium antiporter [Myxococcota bacterium]